MNTPVMTLNANVDYFTMDMRGKNISFSVQSDTNIIVTIPIDKSDDYTVYADGSATSAGIAMEKC